MNSTQKKFNAEIIEDDTADNFTPSQRKNSSKNGRAIIVSKAPSFVQHPSDK